MLAPSLSMGSTQKISLFYFYIIADALFYVIDPAYILVHLCLRDVHLYIFFCKITVVGSLRSNYANYAKSFKQSNLFKL